MLARVITITAAAALVTSAILLVPVFEADSQYYGTQYYGSPNYYGTPQYGGAYQSGLYGSGFYNPGFGFQQTSRLVCPQGYVLIGSLCYLQSFAGFGSFGANPFFGSSFFNSSSFDSRFDSRFFFNDFNQFNRFDFRRPVVDLRADDTSIDEGDSTLLRWDIEFGAANCFASNSRGGSDFTGFLSTLRGSERVFPDRTTTYTLRCTNAFGTGADSVTVQVDERGAHGPFVTVTADDTRIDEGDSTIIRWDVDFDADECTASNSRGDSEFKGSVDSSGGSQRVHPERTTTYNVSCRNGERDFDSVTVHVDED